MERSGVSSVITPDVHALFHHFFLVGTAETGVRRLHHKSGVDQQGSRVGWQGQAPIHFQEETISLCHPERSEGSLAGQRSFAALRMTLLKRLRLTRKTSSLKWIAPCGCQVLYRYKLLLNGYIIEFILTGLQLAAQDFSYWRFGNLLDKDVTLRALESRQVRIG